MTMLSQNLAVWSWENHSNSNNNWSPSPIRVNVQFLQLCLRSSIGNTISKTKTKLMKEIWPQLDETKNKLQQSRGNSNALKVNLLIGMIPAVYLHLFYTFFRDFFCDPFEVKPKVRTSRIKQITGRLEWSGISWVLLHRPGVQVIGTLCPLKHEQTTLWRVWWGLDLPQYENSSEYGSAN